MVLETLTSLFTGITGGALVTIFTLRYTRQQKKAEAEHSAIDNMEGVVERYRKEFDEMPAFRKEINDLSQRVLTLERKMSVSLMYYCEVKDCPQRTPPFGTATEEHLCTRKQSKVSKNETVAISEKNQKRKQD